MKKKGLLILTVLIGITLACRIPGMPADTTQAVKISAQVGGLMQVFAERDQAIFASTGPSLVVLDASDASNLTLLGQTEALPDIIQDVVIEDDYAYVADGEGGLRIIDIAELGNPKEVGNFSDIDFAAFVAVFEDYAYVVGNEASSTASGHGLHVIDISKPEETEKAAFLKLPGYPSFLAVHDDRAYIQVANEKDGKIELVIIDISDPKKPDETESYTIDEREKPTNVAMDMVDKLAYIAVDGELRVIDTEDEANPEELGFLDKADGVCGVAVDSDYAYLAIKNQGVTIVGVADAGDPAVLGVYLAPGDGCRIAAAGNRVYVNARNGLDIVEVSDRNGPIQAGLYAAPATASSVSISDGYAYLISDQARLHIIDISDPNAPDLVANLDSEWLKQPVAASGDYAYTGAAQALLAIIDIQDRAAPIPMGQYRPKGDILPVASDILVDGDYAYIAAGKDGLFIADVSDRANPEEAGSFDAPGLARDVSLVDNLLFMATRRSGLRIINVEDRAYPEEIGYYEADKIFALFVEISGDYAFVAGEKALLVIDISDPENPEKAGSYNLEKPVEAMALLEDRLYIVDSEDNLLVLNIEKEKSPKKETLFKLPCPVSGMAAADDYVYLAADECGLIILSGNDLR